MEVNLNQQKTDEIKISQEYEESSNSLEFEEVNKVQKKQEIKASEELYLPPLAEEFTIIDSNFYKNPYLTKEKMNEDTIKLGSKTWKPNEAQAKENKKIDAAKKISKNATGYTLDIYRNIFDVQIAHDNEARESFSEDALGKEYLRRIQSVHFSAKMFTSSYIIKNYKSCYELIDDYKRLLELNETHDLGDETRKVIASIREIMTLFTKRINEFTKKNHVDTANGNGFDGSLSKEEKLTDEDYRKWILLTGEAKEQRENKRMEALLNQQLQTEIKEEELQEIKENTAELEYVSISTGAEVYIGMTAENRMRSIPSIKGHIKAVENRIKEGASSGLMIGLRKEYTEMKAILRLAEAELCLYEKSIEHNAPLRSIENLRKHFPEEIKELSEASENVRRIKKRYNNPLGLVDQRTLPQGIVKLSREEALSTRSDKASMRKRMNILRISEKLVEGKNPNEIADAQKFELNKLIRIYFDKNAYAAGAREESGAMKDVLSYIDKNKLRNKPEFRDIIKEIDSMTNGNLIFDVDKMQKENGELIDRFHFNPRPEAKEGSNRTFVNIVNSIFKTFTKWEDRKNEPLFAHEPTVNDLRQGKVCNCWMIAATTALINYDPQIIKNCMRDNGDGSVTVRLFTKTVDMNTGADIIRPKYIKVKKETPKLITGGEIQSSGALWMQMLEKAAACIGFRRSDYQNANLGYNALWYGNPMDWMFALTGMNGGMTKFANMDEDGPNEIYNDILHARENGQVYCYGTKDNGAEGMNDGHAYTVLGAREVNGQKYIILRNPYGNASSVYDEKGKLFKTETFMNSSMNETSGQFMIKLEDFVKNGAAVSYVSLKDNKNAKEKSVSELNGQDKPVLSTEEINNEQDDF